jgi:enoyl-CoA hydratase/carnithine racemase
MAEDTILRVDGDVATLTLNRPAHHNALNLASWRSLAARARAIAENPTVRVVILMGAGTRAFSAGADIGEFTAKRSTEASARDYGELVESVLEAWWRIPQPVIAAIQGYCLGAGLELALTADFRIAAENAAFGVPASKRGFGISIGDVRRLAQVVGFAHARSLLLRGEQLTAAQSLHIGLIDEITPMAALQIRAKELAGELAENSPGAMAWMKQVVAIAMSEAGQQLTREERVGAHVFATRDSAEGVAAFLQRRKPSFEGGVWQSGPDYGQAISSKRLADFGDASPSRIGTRVPRRAPSHRPGEARRSADQPAAPGRQSRTESTSREHQNS